jgi:internalin A
LRYSNDIINKLSVGLGMPEETEPLTVKTLRELTRILGQAKQEKWDGLALVNDRNFLDTVPSHIPKKYQFVVEESLEGQISRLSELKDLTALYLYNTTIGKEGALVISGLTKLTSLYLSGGQIGDKGADAISNLVHLTSLDLSSNEIGNNGVKELSKLTNLTSLNLHGNAISNEGAASLSKLSNLSFLDIRDNSIGKEGAASLSKLTNLVSLYLNGQIGDEGAIALSELTNLAALRLPNSQISKKGAEAISKLTNLTTLYLDYNKVGKDGASALSKLTSLTFLGLASNDIGDEGAGAISQLTGLTALYLHGNKIGNDGATALSNLSKLTLLHLADNKIGNEGAIALSRLTTLVFLYLQDNKISNEGIEALLAAWANRNNVQILYVKNNPIQDKFLPRELFESPRAQELLAAYHSYRGAQKKGQLKPLNEAKLLVVGNGGVGKTSLVRALVQGKARDLNEPQTNGIALHERIEIQRWSEESSDITLNIWDFGGQEMLYGTHQFFLTTRSLYLLVLDDRHDTASSILNWLKTIQSRSGGSPIIVVINKCDGEFHSLGLNENGLKRDYPPIVAFVRTSCNKEKIETINKLCSLIAKTLTTDERLRHIRDLLPNSWRRVKDAIEIQTKTPKVLPYADFVLLCEQPGTETINDKALQRALLLLLNDLGVVVAHGLKDHASASRREINLLDPNWLTSALYTLLNHQQIKGKHGVFSRADLHQLLDPKEYPADSHEFIIDMMKDPDLALCFRLPTTGEEQYLLPEALPRSEPEHNVQFEDPLLFRYEYDFLPPGLIPRFLVEAHRYLAEEFAPWWTGAVLKVLGCLVLVRSNEGLKYIELKISGPLEKKRLALGQVVGELEKVHQQYKEIGEKAVVPLPDQPEVQVPYDYLLELEKDEGLNYGFWPYGADRKYTVRELLEGVRQTLSKPKENPKKPRKKLRNKMNQIDVAVIVALKDEFRVLNELLLKGSRNIDDGGRVYYLFSLPNTKLNCIATFVGDMGPTHTAVIAEKALERWRPSLAVMIGIAGGIHGDVKLGDVFVASQVDNFMEKVKVEDSKDDYEFRHSGDGFQQNSSIITKVQNFEFQHQENFKTWQKNAEAWLRGKLPTFDTFIKEGVLRGQPILLEGHLASGPVLAASKEFLKWVHIKDRAYKALEMESGGLVLSIHLNTHGAKALVIRGISDFGDERKSKLDHTGEGVFREYAMRNAVNCLVSFLEAGLFI